jgi:myo-inositol catabolism protein IolC
VAADHRSSLERDLYGLTAPPAPEQAARISADKMLIYQALLDAVPQLPASAQPAILIDEQYGASVAELATRAVGTISLAMPVEASGGQWFHYAYDDWQAHAGLFAADHAKVLIRDNPGLEPGQRAAQAERLAEVSDWAAANDRALIVELLVPASAADLAAAGGAVASHDATSRTEHTVQVIEYLQDHGVTPALWGVESLNHHDDAVAIAAAAKRGGRAADCIILGRHAGQDQLDHWLQVAAPIPGLTGFAIGRSIWHDPLHARLLTAALPRGTRLRIATTYLDFVRYYLDAREGTFRCTTSPIPRSSTPGRWGRRPLKTGVRLVRLAGGSGRRRSRIRGRARRRPGRERQDPGHPEPAQAGRTTCGSRIRRSA